jgi:hypothetical protein
VNERLKAALAATVESLKVGKLEADFEAWAVKEIEKAGGWAPKFTSPGTNGAPDRIVFWRRPKSRRGWRNVLDFVEFKLGEGKDQPSQPLFHERLNHYGWMVSVFRSPSEVLDYIRYRSEEGE